MEAEGYSYLYGLTIAHDGETPERDSFEDVLLLGRVGAAVVRLNPTIPYMARLDAVAQAIRQIQRLKTPDMITDNEAFHRLFNEGVAVI